MPPITKDEAVPVGGGQRSEVWARARLEEGLPLSFPADWPPEDRHLRGSFVVDEVRRWNARPAPSPFNVGNAVITTALTLNAAQIDVEVCFERCSFAAPILFRDVSFAHRVRFGECVFEGDVTLEACRVRELWFAVDLDLTTTQGRPGPIFRGGLSLLNSTIAGDLVCDGARFESDRTAIFNSLAVEGSLFLRSATFNGGVDLVGLTAGSLDAQGAAFLNPNASVNLASAKIAGPAVFRTARFQGPLDLSGADVSGACSFSDAVFAGAAAFIGFAASSAEFDRARFTHQVHGFDFNSARIAVHASFRNAEFGGPAAFTAMAVGGTLDCSDAAFLAAEAGAIFDSANIAGHALFVQTTFHGSVEFGLTEFGGVLNLNGARFLNESRAVSFHAMRARKILWMVGTTFHGPVIMTAIDVGSDLRCDQVKFLSRAHAVDATSLTAKGHASFTGAEFHGPADLRVIQIGGTLNGTGLQSMTEAAYLNFEGATITGSMDFTGARFKGETGFGSVHVEGHAVFNGAHFEKAVNFNSARFDNWALFNDATFDGPAVFRFIRVGSSTEFARATFRSTLEVASAHLEGNLMFSTARATGSASRTVCADVVDFRATRIGAGATFADVAFRKSAFFGHIVIGGDAHFPHAEFDEAADFSSATIKGSARFNGATFGGSLTLARCTIDGDLHFLRVQPDKEAPSDTVFKQAVNADALAVKGELSVQHATFEPDAALTLRGARLGFANFQDTRLADVTLFAAQLALGLVLENTTVEKNADFANVKVTGPARFRSVRVKGSLNFSHADVSDSISLTRSPASQANPKAPCVFEGRADFSGSRFQSDGQFGEEIRNGGDDDVSLRFGAGAFFDHCVFSGPVSVQWARFDGQASFSKVRFLNRVGLFRVDFRDTSRQSATFAEAEFHGQVLMAKTTVAGRLSFFGARALHNLRILSSCRFNREVDFEGASLASLQIEHDGSHVAPDLAFLGTLYMDGCQYQRIKCDLGLAAFWLLLRRSMANIDLTDSHGFTRQPYLQFEQFCRASGENDLADEVYVHFREAERTRDPRRSYRAWNQLERRVFGYGVKPLLMAWWFVAIWIAGAFFLALPFDSWSRSLPRALAVSLGNLVPGTSDFVKAWRTVPETWLTASVGVFQHCVGWALIALLAERFFKGLKR